MAEEDSSSMATPEKMISCVSKSDGFTLSKKTVPSVKADDGSGILSEESLSHTTANNVASRYMRPSNGSCHDMCKYGRKHISEEKPWKVKRRPAKDSADGLAILEKEKFVVQETSRKASDGCLSKSMPSPKIKSFRQADSDVEKGIRRRSSTDNRRHSLDLKHPDAKTHLKSKITPDAPTLSPVKFGLKSRSPVLKKLASPEPPEIIKDVCFSSEVVAVPAEQGSSVDSNQPSEESGKTFKQKDRLSGSKSRVATNRLFESSDGTHGKGRKVPENATRRNKHVITASLEQALSPGSSDLLSRRSLAKTASKVPSKRESAPSVSVSRRSRSLVKSSSFKVRKGQIKLSSLKDQTRLRRVKNEASNSKNASQRTLHAIRTKTVENVFDISDKNHSMLPLSQKKEDAGNGVGEAKLVVKKQYVKAKVPVTIENQSKTLRKGRLAVSEDTANGIAVKLKFKSGKVLDCETETASPRKLRFRRPRLHVNEGTKIDVRPKAFLNSTTVDTVPVEEVSTQKVVLKHQDVQDKKDTQGLFNNVIEETASKLVATRKSKVKALVGAFETVISLQESKPSQPVT